MTVINFTPIGSATDAKSLLLEATRNLSRVENLIIAYSDKDTGKWHWALEGTRAEVRSMLQEMAVSDIVYAILDDAGVLEDEDDADE